MLVHLQRLECFRLMSLIYTINSPLRQTGKDALQFIQHNSLLSHSRVYLEGGVAYTDTGITPGCVDNRGLGREPCGPTRLDVRWCDYRSAVDSGQDKLETGR